MKALNLKILLVAALTGIIIGTIGDANPAISPVICDQDQLISTRALVNPCIFLAGPVGIGTLSPSAALDINTDLSSTLNVLSSANLAQFVIEGAQRSAIIGSAESADKSLSLIAASDVAHGAFISLYGSAKSSHATDAGSVIIGTANSSSDGDILFQTQGLQRLIITQDGRLGLGTESPAAELHVVSPLPVPLRVETSASVARFELEGLIGSTISASSGASDKFLALQASSSIDTGATIALLGNGIEGTGTGTGSVLIEAARGSTVADILFRTMGLNRLIINQDGRVGIGTAEPQEQLHVVGNIQVDGKLHCSKSCIEPQAVRGLKLYITLHDQSVEDSQQSGFRLVDSVFLGKELLSPDDEIRLIVKLVSEENACWEVRFLAIRREGCSSGATRVELKIPYDAFPDEADELELVYRSRTDGETVTILKAWLIVSTI